jgi:hypothetical protein
MRKAFAVAVVVSTLLVATSASAQQPPAAPEKIAVGDWQLAPTLEIRTRGEFRRDPPDIGGRDFFERLTPRVRNAWVVMERSRLGLGAERGALRAQITLQDARALGGPSPTATFAGSRGIDRFMPYEAFGEVRSSGARPNYVRFGRQAVVWGEGRLIGNADFSPVGRSLDAIRAHLALGAFDFEALGVLLEVPGPLGSAFGDTAGPTRSGVQLHGIAAKWRIAPLLEIEAFGLLKIARSSGAELDGSRFQTARLAGDLFTGALRVSGDAKGWTYGAEGAYQFGTASSVGVGGSDVSAWAAYGHVSKLLDQVALTPTVRIAGSYASGDDGSSTYKQFDPLLPDPQRFHGQMDLFGWSNVMDASARVSVVPWTDTSFAVEYRYARLAEARGEWIGSYMNAIGRIAPGVVTAGTANEELGHEGAATFAWRPWVPLELRIGYSALFLGDGARAVMAARERGRRQPDNSISTETIAHYTYAQATLNVP